MDSLQTSVGLEGIAIVGLAGRFPGAKNVEKFWQNLKDGVESISFFSEQELESNGIEPAVVRNPDYVKAKAVLEDVELFDAAFFGFSPKEATITDPQHRLFLESAWEALENAGYNPETYTGAIGVYAGVGMSAYLLNNLWASEFARSAGAYQIIIANDKDFLPTRVSYKLNLKGPSVNIQTACSTSLVAICMACQSLLNYQCDMALAGGVSISLPQKTGYLYQEGMIFSPDGHCRAFDAQAKGTLAGSGVGIVVLKRLEDAIADGDTIHAVIKGFALNNDGAMKVGYTAPSVDGQAEVIAQALAMAEVDPESVTYIEAHGTGTPLGDPIEIAALTKAFHASTQKKNFCAIGSVKTNIGHLDTAAGVTGLIKTVQALKHQSLPPSLHFETPNPKIDFANSPFYVNTKLTAWQKNGSPRRAGVSSFGIGGTNAHVVLEEAPSLRGQGGRGAEEQGRNYQLLIVSAKSESALDTATHNLIAHLKQHPELNLADVAYTLAVGRKAFSHRRIVVCSDSEDAVTVLSSLDPKRVLTNTQESKQRPITFMFSGQGSQYVNMALELYQVESTFREQIDKCSEFLKPDLGIDLRDVLYPSEEQAEIAAQQLKQTAITQPALFVIEYALAQLWMSWGVRPQATIGHSIGEYVAACIAGVFSLEDALSLVAARGRLMQQMPPGAMLAVPLKETEVRSHLNEHLSLAVINAPSSCVIAGTIAEIDALEQQLPESRRLHTSHAFHSQMMEPILEPFIERVKKVKLNPPQTPYISNVTGTWITAAEATNPNYWAQHLRQTVRFADGVQQLMQDPNRILLEVGPGRTLMTLAKQHPDKDAGAVILSSLRHPQEEQSDVAFLLNTLGRLWLAGVEIDWSEFYTGEQRYRVPLPTYPFERQRYWIEPQAVSGMDWAQTEAANSLTKQSDIADWFYIPSWQRSPIPVQNTDGTKEGSCWLVFLDECGLGDRIVNQLKLASQDVITVSIGKYFSSEGNNIYTINPSQLQDYDALLKELYALNKMPQTIVHLWSVTPNESSKTRFEQVEKLQNLGFWSLFFLAQAIGKQNLSDCAERSAGGNRLKIAVISNNLQEVTGEENLCPEKATLLGPCKVIPQEYLNISCRSIDIVLPEPGTQQEEKLISNLLTEITIQTSDIAIAYRGNHRWLQTFAPVRLDKTEKARPRLKNGGVYLITGGLGGIGLVLAEYLAKTVQAKLVLVGRSPFPKKSEWEQWLTSHDEQDSTSVKIRKFQDMEALGAEVIVACADVANLEQMQAVICEIGDRFGSIHGVIHAAGISPAGTIQMKTPETSASLLAPKLQGTLVLDTLLKNLNLDFFVLCSSLNSFLPFPGVVDHCGANAFLDAFAQYNTTRSNRFTVAINWDSWQEVGQAANAIVPAELKKWREESLKHGILPSEGTEAFSRILAIALPQVLVSTQDFIARFQQHFVSQPLLVNYNPSKQLHSRPELSNAYVAPRNGLEQTIADIWQKCLGVEPVGIGDDFFELGGDSLLAVHLLGKVSEATQTKLSPHSLIDAPTIAALIKLIETTHSPSITKTLPSSLVKIQAGNLQTPLFLVHAAGGHVYQYRDLAHYLGSDQPVYGLQSENTAGESHNLTQVEEMAAHYLKAVRIVQSQGPYFLGGASFGGMIAYEMAQQLQAVGEKVALLALIDTPGPGHMPSENIEDDELKIMAYLLDVGANVAIASDSLEQLSADERLRYFLEQGKTALRMPADLDISELRHYYHLFRSNIKAMRSYVPQAYPGRVIFFRASDRDSFNPQNPELGWQNLAIEGLEIHEVPGNHITMNFPPHVQVMANCLKIYLESDTYTELHSKIVN
ncbi:MAG: SDR family NAD(P)-dependent oxidoreductase [Mojavia pulchra JT2-VF2]|jgi:acyl transferase domain-containing protein/thioesterase domain-containing protein/acyl carrier protein|uniref:Phenolphthiocerol/phthiocerol polyketide synthase subunit E n=1 Tax=Mojavia pulchra JT2-VF2 TaxID=287848 RepID=A0A951Q048_9NOST|nr:SDR family NAD(P)-dependent oxidoreductase [Mojavia pulchra JT2-VF2]